MRIYAVADIHGKAENLARIRSLVDRLKPDVLVAAGDLTNFSRAEAVVARLNGLAVPVLAVRGNTDRPAIDDLLARYPNTTNLHLSTTTIGGVRFAGAGGTIPLPFRSRICLREKALIDQLAAVSSSETVVVVHPPPKGTLDMAFGRFHVGSRVVAAFVERTRPPLLICGHVHEHSGIASLNATVVVNCAMSAKCAGALIQIDGHRIADAALLR
jgi:Icc-related predicted phosphoesterase